MVSSADIRQGMEVYGSDEQLIGTVERVRGEELLVNGVAIPLSAVARVVRGRAYLGDTGARYRAGAAGEAAAVAEARTLEGERELRVPVHEERLDVTKREGELGEVTVHKTVTEERVSVPVELRREQVRVERVDVEDRPIEAAAAEAAFREGTTRVPVRGEEAIIEKEAVVTGEVVIEKERVVERREVRDTVRKERVDIDEDYEKYRGDFERHFAGGGRAAGGARTFAEAEPGYRWGFAAARDERWSGRAFDEVEPELRREYEAGAGRGADPWERLREAVRAAWDRARARA